MIVDNPNVDEIGSLQPKPSWRVRLARMPGPESLRTIRLTPKKRSCRRIRRRDRGHDGAHHHPEPERPAAAAPGGAQHRNSRPRGLRGRADRPGRNLYGPFRIVEHIPEQALRLEANVDYWGGDVQIEAAEVRFVPDGGVRATQVQTGEAHISRVIPGSALDKLKTVAGVNVMTIETTRTNGLYLDNERAPFDNVNTRRAVQSAIDTAAIGRVSARHRGRGSARRARGQRGDVRHPESRRAAGVLARAARDPGVRAPSRLAPVGRLAGAIPHRHARSTRPSCASSTCCSRFRRSSWRCS